MEAGQTADIIFVVSRLFTTRFDDNYFSSWYTGYVLLDKHAMFPENFEVLQIVAILENHGNIKNSVAQVEKCHR